MRSVVWAALLIPLLAGAEVAAQAAAGAPPRLVIVVDGPIRGADARSLEKAVEKGLSKLPKAWRVSVIGSRATLVEASPLFYARDSRAIRNATRALAWGEAKLMARLSHALSELPHNVLPADLRLLVLASTAPASADLAPLEKKAKERGVALSLLALRSGAEASPAAGEPPLKPLLAVEVIAEGVAGLVEKMVREQLAAAKAAKARAMAGTLKRWTWRHWLYVAGGALALLVLLRMIWGVLSRGRVRRQMRRRAAKLVEERAQTEERVKTGHATIVDAVAELLAFVAEVYAIFPCKRCEETLFELSDVTSNGRSIQLSCDACGLGVWAKCGITEPPPDLDQNFDHLRATIEANRKAGKKIGMKLSYPPILVQSNVQFEEDAAGQKIERVIVRERMTVRPKLLIQCAYCRKTVYYEGRCPECGARRDTDAGA